MQYPSVGEKFSQNADRVTATMHAEEPLSESDADRLDQILARYLTELESGKQPDREQLIVAHPQLAGPLRAFFHNHDEMRGVAEGIQGPSEAHDPEAAIPPGVELPTSPLAPKSSTGFESGIGCEGRFGDYELIEEIERGGMGVVFRARQISLDRIVALKVIKSGHLAGPQEIRRFHVEAEAAANLHHPGIVPVYEVGQVEGLHYYTMQFVSGQSLATRLEKGPLPPDEAAQLILQVARAVAYAHAHGVIHRDLKPANILLEVNGQPKITDFGLAKRLRAEGGLTATGQILGTPAYMAPEQAAGRDRRVGEVTDVYALGALLYATLTGQAPHSATNEVDLLLKVLDSDPLPPSHVQAGVPASLDQVCLCCLEKDPQKRYPSAAAVAKDLERFLREEPLEVPSCGLCSQLARWGRREPALVTHLTAVLAFLVMLSIVYFWVGSEPHYYLRHFSALMSWLGLSFLLQRLLNQPRWAYFARFLWATTDVLLLTLILYMALPPRGPLLIGYPVLIVASSMLARTRLVWFTTVLATVGYLVLVTLRAEEEFTKPHFCVFYVMGLIVVGCLAAAQVKRIRALTRYYEGTPISSSSGE